MNTLYDDSDGHVDPTITYLSWDKFAEIYKPIKNHIDKDAGMFFETYGQEVEFVKAQPPQNVWTMLDVDDDENFEPVIINGMHYVNRINYFVTEVAHNPHEEIIVNE